MAETTLKVSGMTCNHCVHAVTQALMGVDGVYQADVDLGSGKAQVRYDEARADTSTMTSAVAEEGYEAEVSG